MSESYRLGEGTGPLRGVRVVEVAGIGPGPHAAMILADLGADVIRVERPGGALSPGPREADLLTRGRPSVAMNLKDPRAVATVLDLAEKADILLEGMRPGTAERLGLGPDECLARNPRLVYGRMTGWGQHGPLARTAGHDLSYIAVAGVLHGLGQSPERPQFPSNLVGDFGGGSTYVPRARRCGCAAASLSGSTGAQQASLPSKTSDHSAWVFSRNRSANAWRSAGHCPMSVRLGALPARPRRSSSSS
jgi:alpha-methylacyl-CoA racemase